RSRNTVAFDRASNPVIGVNRYRALLDDDLVGMNRTGNLAGHSVNIRQISIAGCALRRPHSNEDDLRRLRGMTKISGELHLAAASVPPQQLGKKLLVNRHQSLVQFVYLIFIVVNAEDAVADLSKAC